jgi:hypothetical protein
VRQTATQPATVGIPAAERARTLARNLRRQCLVRSFLLFLLISAAVPAQAQDDVTLAEIMPELSGTELGNVPVAHAPPLGATLTLHKSDVLRALARAGVSPDGLTIPSSSRISRKQIRLAASALRDAAEAALGEVAGACAIVEARLPDEISVGDGPRSVHAEIGPTLRTGKMSATIIVESAGHATRVPTTVTLQCPEPEITAGKQVTLLAIVGNVTASAPGEARQNGRIGDLIRVTNRATGASLRGRVVDAQSVEIVQ